MSVTVHSRVVESDELYPRNIHNVESRHYCGPVSHTSGTWLTLLSETDLAKLTPWVFEHLSSAGSDCTGLWPSDRPQFRDFFDYLQDFHDDMDDPSYCGMPRALNVTNTISILRKHWAVPKRQGFESRIRLQGFLVKILLGTIYYLLADTLKDAYEL